MSSPSFAFLLTHRIYLSLCNPFHYILLSKTHLMWFYNTLHLFSPVVLLMKRQRLLYNAPSRNHM